MAPAPDLGAGFDPPRASSCTSASHLRSRFGEAENGSGPGCGPSRRRPRRASVVPLTVYLLVAYFRELPLDIDESVSRTFSGESTLVS